MKGKLQLKEIIWEIIPTCKNGCKYCGSKELRDIKPNNKHIMSILDKILEYPPEKIDISGGDPLLLDICTHQNIVGRLKQKNIEVKILCNPFSLDKNDTNIEKLRLYDWVGFSINNEEEIDAYNKFFENKTSFSNQTIITNFNLSNIFLFDEIRNFVRTMVTPLWMVQFTIYRDQDNSMAIYNNEKAVDEFFKKLQETRESFQEIDLVLSDNLNDSPCSAGINSIGITYDGHVIPCLAMRCWMTNNEIISNSQGNLISEKSSNKLEDIWKHEFINCRFNQFKCCKEHCKCKSFIFDESVLTMKMVEDIIKKRKKSKKNFEEESDESRYPNEYLKLIKELEKTKPDKNSVYVYGVTTGDYTTTASSYTLDSTTTASSYTLDSNDIKKYSKKNKLK